MNDSKRNRITRNFFRELLHVLSTERKIDVVTAVDIATKETERLKKDLTKSEAFASSFEEVWDEAFSSMPTVCEHEPVDTGMIYSWCKKCNTDMALNKPKGEWEVRYPTKQPKEQESD